MADSKPGFLSRFAGVVVGGVLGAVAGALRGIVEATAAGGAVLGLPGAVAGFFIGGIVWGGINAVIGLGRGISQGFTGGLGAGAAEAANILLPEPKTPVSREASARQSESKSENISNARPQSDLNKNAQLYHSASHVRSQAPTLRTTPSPSSTMTIPYPNQTVAPQQPKVVAPPRSAQETSGPRINANPKPQVSTRPGLSLAQSVKAKEPDSAPSDPTPTIPTRRMR